MDTYQVKSFADGKTNGKPHFFVLNKGMNSGKPMQTACPNCFIFEVTDQKQYDYFFWLIYGLWRTRSFHSYLRGSVIPFITIKDFKSCMHTANEQANKNMVKFNNHVEILKILDLKEKQFKENLLLIDEARKVIFYQYRKR